MLLCQGLHRVLYDDGQEETLNMVKEEFEFCRPIPQLEMQHNSTDTAQLDASTEAKAEQSVLPKPSAMLFDIASEAQNVQGGNASVQAESSYAHVQHLTVSAANADSDAQHLSDKSRQAETSNNTATKATADAGKVADAGSRDDSSNANCTGSLTDKAAHDKTDIASGAHTANSRAKAGGTAAHAYDYCVTQAGASNDHEQPVRTRRGGQQPKLPGKKRLLKAQAAAVKRQKQLHKKLPPLPHKDNTAQLPVQSSIPASTAAKESDEMKPEDKPAPNVEGNAVAQIDEPESSQQGHTPSPHAQQQQQQGPKLSVQETTKEQQHSTEHQTATTVLEHQPAQAPVPKAPDRHAVDPNSALTGGSAEQQVGFACCFSTF